MINKRRKGGWIKWVVLAIVLVALAVLAYPTIQQMLQGGSSTNRTTGEMGNAMQVNADALGGNAQSVATARRGQLKVTVSGTGKISPASTKTVYGRTSGRVDGLDIEVGDSVKAGDVVVRLGSDDLATSIAALTRTLFDAQVALAAVRDSGSSYNIYAPTAGRVKDLKVETDDDVATAMKQFGYLAIISRDDKMKVEFVPETNADLYVGDKLNVLIKNTTVQGTVSQVTGLSGNIAVTVPDDKYEIGESVIVSTLLGEKLGSGFLEVNMPVPVTGIGGTVSSIYYDEEDTVGSGYRMFYLTGRTPSSDLQSALLAYQEAKIALDTATDKQDGLVIRAPMDGVITSLSISEGAQLEEGAAAFTIQSNNDYKVVASVDELDIVDVKVGQSVSVELDAFPNRKFNAVVTNISGMGTVESGVATYDVTVRLEGNEGFMDGMTANIEVVTQDKNDTLLVPVEAISTSNGQNYVTLASGERAQVETGSSDGTNIEILSGINDGDVVRLTRTTNSGSVGTFTQGGGNATFIAAPTGGGNTQRIGGSGGSGGGQMMIRSGF